MRSAVIWIGGSVVAIIFAMAATTPPAVISGPVAAAQIGPRQKVPTLSSNHIRRMWIKELIGMSSGSAKTSSSVSSSSAIGRCGEHSVPTLTVSGDRDCTLTETIVDLGSSELSVQWLMGGIACGSDMDCRLLVRVDCVDGVLLPVLHMNGVPITTGLTVDVVSADPVMIIVSWADDNPVTGCVGGEIVISE